MGQADWDLLAKRRSCSLLARRATAEGGTATTPTTASVVGAIQAQEVVKYLHGLEVLRGRAYVFEGLTHHSFTVDYRVAPDCPWHGEPIAMESADDFDKSTPMRRIWERAVERLGELDAIDLSRDLIDVLICPSCGTERPTRKPAEAVLEDEVRCPVCRAECVPRFFHSLTGESPLLNLTTAELGLPAWDVVWARQGDQMIGFEMTGDRAECLHS